MRPRPADVLRLLRLQAMLGEPFDAARFRALLWAEFDAWQASRNAAAWGPYLGDQVPSGSTQREPDRGGADA